MRLRHPRNHLLLDASNGSIVEFPALKSFDADYFKVLLGWLTEWLPGVY